jgi:hypothetical protein
MRAGMRVNRKKILRETPALYSSYNFPLINWIARYERYLLIQRSRYIVDFNTVPPLAIGEGPPSILLLVDTIKPRV